MKIFMPVVQPRRTRGFAESLNTIGWQLFIAGKTFVPDVGRNLTYSTNEAELLFGPNVTAYEGNDIFDDPPDVVVNGREDCEDKLLRLSQQLSDIKVCVVCFYSGNFHSGFNWSAYAGGFCTDKASYLVSRVHRTPCIMFRPMFSFDSFPYRKQPATDSLVLRSYIQSFADRFTTAYEIYRRSAQALNERTGGRVTIENVEYRSLAEVNRLMIESSATLHIKDQEGFGWSVLESMAVGRPVILHRGLSKHMALEEWAVDSKTAVYFDTVDELGNIVDRFLADPTHLHALQEETAMTIRQIYRPEQSAKELGKFLENIVANARYAWYDGSYTKRKILLSVRRHTPKESAFFVQGWELWLSEYWHNNQLRIPGAAFRVIGDYASDGQAIPKVTKDLTTVVWGPYIQLRRDKYYAEFNLSCTGKPTLGFDVAVTVPRGAAVLQVVIEPRVYDDGDHVVRIPFIVEREDGQIEFRVKAKHERGEHNARLDDHFVVLREVKVSVAETGP
jgi:hypothetical protein